MDESAEWRRRYDSEFEKPAKCCRALDEFKNPGGETATVSTTQNKKIEMLQKENMNLLERVETLKQELEAEKLKCSEICKGQLLEGRSMVVFEEHVNVFEEHSGPLGHRLHYLLKGSRM